MNNKWYGTFGSQHALYKDFYVIIDSLQPITQQYAYELFNSEYGNLTSMVRQSIQEQYFPSGVLNIIKV